MSDCACLYFGEATDMPSFMTDKVRVARKEHRCTECGETIRVGSRYENTAGVWAGQFSVWKTCASCKDIRDNLTCDGTWIYGELWETVNDALPDICAKTLDELTDGRPRAGEGDAGARRGAAVVKAVEITPLKGRPGVVDEIKLGSAVHIERMGKHLYWCRIGDAQFHIRTAARRGPGIEIVTIVEPEEGP